ncbi:hypothetical protein MVEN_02297300 [Mycena venus]|uniref:Uncharacterized protein n=1 Tax=Mycena venus TaxID=2733690 RepID=A0A8H6X552_9AGAR|nr:hypothetical protein MVEN_02297300 [Mycena venus]
MSSVSPSQSTPPGGLRSSSSADSTSSADSSSSANSSSSADSTSFSSTTSSPGSTSSPVSTSSNAPSTSSASQVHSSTSVMSMTLLPTISTSPQPITVQSSVSGSHRSRNIIVGTVVPIGLFILVSLAIWVRIRRRNRRAPHPEPRRMSPFMQAHVPQVPPSIASAPSDTHSVTASSVRRQYLERELRAAQEKLVDVGDLERRHHSISRAAPTSLFHSFSARGRSTRHNSERVPKSELDAARQRNEELLARIRDLEAQMESAWALGLSDEPPPGYSD